MAYQKPTAARTCEFDEDETDFSFCGLLANNQTFIGRCLNKTNKNESRRGDGDLSAGHVGRYISLANPDRLSQAVRHVPLGLFTGSTLFFLGLALFYPPGYLACFMLLSSLVFLFIVYLCLGSVYGSIKMRQAANTNWTRQWDEFVKKNPGIDEGLLHVVILPNYKEDEQMLSETISNLSQSDMAGKYMVVVLAMEAREGEQGHLKAERLIARHQRQFKEMFATYHPEKIPYEVVGKSSNTQWAFREVQRWYGGLISQADTSEHDTSKVFLTVADADSLHHKDYFNSLSLRGLQMTSTERSWTVFQSPILLTRNFETVPAMVRTSAYATILFELAGLSYAKYADHCCFSAYSLPLSLANHPMVDGWDADVIAEDHHMYMKCMMASYWEEIFSTKQVTQISKLAMEPIWLPVTSYMVEDAAGAWASFVARFQQARRHCQGVAELSYLALQYLTILQEHSIPWRAHYQMLALMNKYCTIHIWLSINSVLCFATGAAGIVWAVVNYFSGDLHEKVMNISNDMSDLHEKQSTVVTLVMCVPVFLGFFLAFINYLVVKDSVEGRFCPLYLQAVTDPARANKKVSPLSFMEKVKLYMLMVYDTYVLGQFTLVAFATVPAIMAACSLSVYGHKFDYIVGAKPEFQNAKPKEAVKPANTGNAVNALAAKMYGKQHKYEGLANDEIEGFEMGRV